MGTRACFGRNPFTNSGFALTFSDRILSLTAREELPTDLFVAPGFIDLQVNGFAGVDYNSPETPAEEIGRSIEALFATGVTRFLPTIITSSEENIVGCLRNLVKARESLGHIGKSIIGFHIEGPHISPEDGPRGAHPRQWVRPPDIEEFKRWQDAAMGLIRLVTLSPEWPEATTYIEYLVKVGVTVSIGHTAANSQQIADAVRAGARMSTHLGNGAHFFIRRHPNYIWDQLAEDRLMASFIVDGVHLPASFVKVAFRAKGPERFILVTDAVMPAGCPPGRYRIGDVEVELLPPGDRVVLAGQDRLAGSALKLHDGIANLMAMTGASLREAIATATVNPARAIHLHGRERGLAQDELADLVLLRHEEGGGLQILETILEGQTVYRA